MDIQLEGEMYMSGRGQSGGRIIVQCYGNCNKPGHNTCICKKDEEMFNVYSSD